MAAERIGAGRCWNPRCGSTKTRVSLQKTGYSCMTCDRCNSQLFARSDLSDQGVRSFLLGQPGEPPAPPVPSLAPAPAPEPAPAPAPKPASGGGMGWGIFGGGS